MSTSLGDWLKSINFTKENLLAENPDEEKDYVPYIINRCLSYFPDTIYHAQELNRRAILPKDMQYDYLRLAVRKKKRFSPWEKKAVSEDHKLVKEYFGYSDKKASDALEVLSEDDLETIKSRLERGGVVKR